MIKIYSKKSIAVAIFLLFISINIITSTGNIISFDDTTPPVSNHTMVPAEPDGDNGWYVNDVEVTVTAYDDESGVKEIRYRINNESWEIIPDDHTSFVIDEDGDDILIEYYAVDNAGNIEDIKNWTLKIDKTKPKINYFAWKLIDLNVEFNSSCIDALSGMNRVEFHFDDTIQHTIYGPGPLYSWIANKPDIWNFELVAFDNAGNYWDDSLSFSSPKYSKVMGFFRNPEYSDTCMRFDAVFIIISYHMPDYPNHWPYVLGRIYTGEKLMFIRNIKSGFIGEEFIRATFVTY